MDLLVPNRLIEVILVDVTKSDDLLLTFEYFNTYHVNKLSGGMERSQDGTNIVCAPVDCFDQLVLVGKNVSNLNKYFWTTIEMFDKYNGLLGQRRSNKVLICQNILYARETYKRVADVSSFHDFVIYLLLQEVLLSGHAGQPTHTLFPSGRLQFFGSKEYSFQMEGVQKYGFVSCYGISDTASILGTLSSPFDVTSWDT
ncbi:hypothetical protein Fcan01_28604 [Folsomia candida]|uniref:Uncharacterized protein n=1 Tax=Folsomia candida TaxID=158441 RepID=A0A226CV59_FOLCA|nr:hypothetical protein Fcan01_28604 [Folsomia candida]